MDLKAILGYAAPYRASLAIAGALMLVEAGTALVVPWLGGRFAGGILSDSRVNTGTILLGLLGVFVVQAAIKFANTYILSRTAESILADLKIRIYDHVQMLPLSYLQRRRQGDVLSLITHDVPRLSGFITGTLLSTVPMLLILAGAVVQMLRIDAVMALIVALMAPAFVLTLKLFGRRMRSVSSELQQEHASAVALVEENLGMIPAIKIFTREPIESRRHAEQTFRVMNLSLTEQRLYALLDPAVQLIASIGIVLLLWLANGRASGPRMSPTELISFLLYASLLTRPLNSLASLYGQVQMMRGVVERLSSVLAERPEPSGTTGHMFQKVRGEIEFRNVSFAYPGRDATLRDVSLLIRSGETIAITGPNGAGKSTMIQLLMRLHEITRGKILLDGVDISGANLHSLRRQISIVPQQVLLLNASVRSNIAYGNPDAGEEAIEQAAKAAQAHDFILGLPSGYDTIIGDNGIRLSGGQRQRIALARALIKDPPILVLDEATAMFDPEGERSFISQCHDVLAQRTVLLITHRPASLALADRVVKLENGEITSIERGPSRQAELGTV